MLLAVPCDGHSFSRRLDSLSYRDDHEAALARAQALEAENAALRRQLAQGKRAKAVSIRPASTTSDGVIAHTLITVFGGMLLIALPCVPGVAGGRFDGNTMIAIAILTLAGPALASTAFRLLRPRALILEKLESGEQIPVHRSMKARRIYFAISLAVYTVGVLLALL